MIKKEPLFDLPYLGPFSKRNVFLPLCIFFLGGTLAGSAAVSYMSLLDLYSVFPLQLSGIPSPESGFLSCFSTLLLNAFMTLLALFLLGVTAFGAFGVPLLLLCKGAAMGIGILSFLSNGFFARCMFCYLPGAAGSALLLLLFGTRAYAFSKSLAKAGFTSSNENLDFRFYFKDFLTFLSFTVAVSLAASLMAMLYVTLQ